MAQIRIEKNAGFTTIPNELIQSRELSLKAKGLLIYMLSLPADWDYSIGGLSSLCREGHTAIRSAIAELMEAGYVTRHQTRREDGTLDGYEYVVYETPPSCENLTTDIQTSENRTEQNKYRTKEIYNTPLTPQTDEGEESQPEQPGKPEQKKRTASGDYRPEWFDALWALYPRKDGKQNAKKAWNRLKPDKATCLAMRAALERDKRSRQWTKDNGEFIPLPATWLNQRRWEDEGVDRAQLSGSGGWAEDPEVTS